MLDVKYLRKKCPDGIPFSECKKLLQQENKKKRTILGESSYNYSWKSTGGRVQVACQK